MTAGAPRGPVVERLARDLLDRGPRRSDWPGSCAYGWRPRPGSVPSPRRTATRSARSCAPRPTRMPCGMCGPSCAWRRLLLVGSSCRAGLRGLRVGEGRPRFHGHVSAARRRFNLEVTRLRHVPGATATTYGAPLLAKLRQLPPSVPNAVLVAIEGDTADAFDVAAATQALRSRADAKDEAFFTRRGFEGTQRVLRAVSAPRRGIRLVRGRGRGRARERYGPTDRRASPCRSEPCAPAFDASEAGDRPPRWSSELPDPAYPLPSSRRAAWTMSSLVLAWPSMPQPPSGDS